MNLLKSLNKKWYSAANTIQTFFHRKIEITVSVGVCDFHRPLLFFLDKNAMIFV